MSLLHCFNCFPHKYMDLNWEEKIWSIPKKKNGIFHHHYKSHPMLISEMTYFEKQWDFRAESLIFSNEEQIRPASLHVSFSFHIRDDKFTKMHALISGQKVLWYTTLLTFKGFESVVYFLQNKSWKYFFPILRKCLVRNVQFSEPKSVFLRGSLWIFSDQVSDN